jgi:hypothetical protein
MARPCRCVGVAIALQPTWRGSPRADCGEHGLVACAGKLPALCRPARPRARPVSFAAVYGATLPLRRRRAAESHRCAPSPAPPTLPVRAAPGLSLGPASTTPNQRLWSSPWAGPPEHREDPGDSRGYRRGFAARRGSGGCAAARGGAARARRRRRLGRALNIHEPWTLIFFPEFLGVFEVSGSAHKGPWGGEPNSARLLIQRRAA